MPNNEIIHSEEAQEILGRIPPWIIRWGITVVVCIFALILIGCYFIQYPKIVKAPITITTINPPSDLAAKYGGLIDSVFFSSGEKVSQEDIIMSLATTADLEDIMFLKNKLQAYHDIDTCIFGSQEWLFKGYTLGVIQPTWSDFQNHCLNYHNYISISQIKNKKLLLLVQINKNEDYYNTLLTQKKLLQKDYEYELISYKRDSALFKEKVFSAFEFENAARKLIAAENSIASFNSTLASTELNILQTRQQIEELDMQEKKELSEYERLFLGLRQQLIAQISQWEDQYLIIAPMAGIVSLKSHWSKNQHVNLGDILVSVESDSEVKVIARSNVPSNGFGRVAVGQKVNVKLNGFPYMEYGVLKGTVSSISSVPVQQQTQNGTLTSYIVEIHFPETLRTSYNKDLPMIQQMDGTAEIITEDMRLIEQFIQPIISLFKN